MANIVAPRLQSNKVFLWCDLVTYFFHPHNPNATSSKKSCRQMFWQSLMNILSKGRSRRMWKLKCWWLKSWDNRFSLLINNIIQNAQVSDKVISNFLNLKMIYTSPLVTVKITQINLFISSNRNLGPFNMWQKCLG